MCMLDGKMHDNYKYDEYNEYEGNDDDDEYYENDGNDDDDSRWYPAATVDPPKNNTPQTKAYMLKATKMIFAMSIRVGTDTL